jgi:cell division cycle protein 20 (cofactor of APC complex)
VFALASEKKLDQLLETRWRVPARLRDIKRDPVKVLDAPDLTDDFYTSLVSWSSAGVLAIALHATVYLYDFARAKVETLCECPLEVTALTWDPDGKLLALGFGQERESTLEIWRREPHEKIRSYADRGSTVHTMSWTHGRLSTGALDGSIRCDDVRAAKHRIETRATAHESKVCGLAWRDDGTLLASGGNDNRLAIWDARNRAYLVKKDEAHAGAIRALAWCPWQANLLASGGGLQDGRLHFWNASTRARIASVETGSQVNRTVAQ